jgi:hypothetical protein
MWSSRPDLNVGICSGDGIVVIDIDEHDGKMSGAEALAQLEEIYGPLPVTLTSITGSGGRHLIFSVPQGHAFGNKLPVISAWLKDTTGKATGGVIDVKGKGGLIVLPPSIHPNGNLYRWEDPDTAIAELPLAWCQNPTALSLTDPERRPRRGRTPPSRPKARIAEGELDPLDIEARERLANVDPNALLGRATLERIRDEYPDDTDRSHHMYCIILGAASVRYDPDKLYELLLDSPCSEGLREHGRAWFDHNMLTAHRYLVGHLAVIADLRTERVILGAVTFLGRNGTEQTVRAKPLALVWDAVLDIAEDTASTAPMVGAEYQLPRMTGLSKNTCVKALQGIESLGWATAEDVSDKIQSAYRYHLELSEPIPTGRAAPQKANRAVERIRARATTP